MVMQRERHCAKYALSHWQALHQLTIRDDAFLVCKTEKIITRFLMIATYGFTESASRPPVIERTAPSLAKVGVEPSRQHG